MMMIIVLAVRLLFCWVEFTIRARQRRSNDAGTSDNTTAELSNEDVNPSDEHAVGAKSSRRSSMAVLYNRIVRSEEAPVEVKYMAGAAFALQAVLFGTFAASLGRFLGKAAIE